MDHPNDPHNIFEMIQRIKCKYKTLIIKEIRKGMHKAGSEPGEKKPDRILEILSTFIP